MCILKEIYPYTKASFKKSGAQVLDMTKKGSRTPLSGVWMAVKFEMVNRDRGYRKHCDLKQGNC
jgi:hypothetical protein